MVDLSFNFTAVCWRWQSEKAAWYFVTLPQEQSEEIRFFNENLSHKKRGWGAVRVQVTIGQTMWETSVFPHKESNAYILPIKASVRKAERIEEGGEVALALRINV